MIEWVIESWWGLWKVGLARCSLAKCFEWYLVVLASTVSAPQTPRGEKLPMPHVCSVFMHCLITYRYVTYMYITYILIQAFVNRASENMRQYHCSFLSIHYRRGRQWTETSACAVRTLGLRETPSLYECIHLTGTIYSNWNRIKGREKETVRWFPSSLGLHSILQPEESGFFWKRKFGQHRGGRQSPSPLQPKPPGRVGLSQPGHGPYMLPILKLERGGSAFRPHPGESALTGSEMSFTSSCHKWQPLDPSLPFSPHFRGCKHQVEPWYILKGFTRKKGHMESMLSNIQPQERAADFRQFGDPRKYNFPYSTSLRFVGVYNQCFKKPPLNELHQQSLRQFPLL